MRKECANCFEAGHAVSVSNLPTRSSDATLKDGLHNNFKKFGKVLNVSLSGDSGDNRQALIVFNKYVSSVSRVNLIQGGQPGRSRHRDKQLELVRVAHPGACRLDGDRIGWRDSIPS